MLPLKHLVAGRCPLKTVAMADDASFRYSLGNGEAGHTVTIGLLSGQNYLHQHAKDIVIYDKNII